MEEHKEPLMERGPYKFHACCSRMNEFFDWVEIDWYLANIESYNLNPHGAIRWLDEEVRLDYLTGVDRTPDISDRVIQYLTEHDIKL